MQSVKYLSAFCEPVCANHVLVCVYGPLDCVGCLASVWELRVAIVVPLPAIMLLAMSDTLTFNVVIARGCCVKVPVCEGWHLWTICG